MTYPDTSSGAQALLRAQRIVTDGSDPASATYTPDPAVRGCWLATFPDGSRCIVYCGDHPFAPDFEDVS